MGSDFLLILEQETIHLSHAHSVTDSIGQVYQITIFPRDSFEFSMERGFMGKAAKVELTGLIRQLNREMIALSLWFPKARRQGLK